MRDKVSALVVDDNEINLMVAQEALRSVSVEADLAGSGAKAVEMCRLRRYDVILMDHWMPGMDGLETAKHIRAFCDTPIVAMTANEDPDAYSLFLDNGFAGFLLKPIDITRLDELFAQVLPQKKLAPSRPQTTETGSIPWLTSELGLDTKTAIEKFGGNESAYLNIVRAFARTAPSKLRDLETFLGKMDWESFRIAIHGQKGALSNVGATGLSEEARTMEMAVRKGDTSKVPSAFKTFRTRLTGLLHKLDAIWPNNIQPSHGATENDRERLPAQLRAIGDRIRNLEQDEALEALTPLLNIRFDDPVASGLTALRSDIDAFDYDGALQRIERLLKGVLL